MKNLLLVIFLLTSSKLFAAESSIYDCVPAESKIICVGEIILNRINEIAEGLKPKEEEELKKEVFPSFSMEPGNYLVYESKNASSPTKRRRVRLDTDNGKMIFYYYGSDGSHLSTYRCPDLVTNRPVVCYRSDSTNYAHQFLVVLGTNEFLITWDDSTWRYVKE